MENFESLRMELVERRKELVESKFDYTKVNAFTKDFKKLFEALIFDLTTSSDDFFGNVLVSLNRKYNYCLNTPMNHQVFGMAAVIHINPLMFVVFSREQMKNLIKHEIYHIIGQHAKRSAQFLDVAPRRLIALACDLVACENMGIQSTGNWWTYNKLKEEFGITLNHANTVEDNIKELMVEVKKNEDFADFVGDVGVEVVVDEDFLDMDESEMEKAWEDMQDEMEDLSLFFLLASSADELELMDDFIRTVINTAASNSRGLLPSGVKAILDELTGEPKIAWQRVLCKRLGSLPVPYKKTIVRNDRRLPNRLDLKGRMADRIAKLFVAIDTSGSVSDKEIEYVLNEINAIARVYKADVTVVEADASVQRVYKLNKAKKEKAKVDVEGRGGTCFSPAIEYLQKEEGMSKDSVLIYFTDGGGETTVPKMTNSMIWVLTRNEPLSVTNPQGKVLKLEDDSKFIKQFR